MSSSRPLVPGRLLCLLLIASLLVITGCQTGNPPAGPAGNYADAADMFKKGNFDRALDLSEGVANASPANAYTERAQVLRIIIYGSRVRAYEELADAYSAGAAETKNSRFKAAYEQLQSDAEQLAANSSLGLAQTAHQMMSGAGIGSEVVVEVPYPTVQGPTEVSQLEKVKGGEWIEPSDQNAASVAALLKGIDDELADAVGGDRVKAQTELAAGPVKVSGLDFTLFLTKQLLSGATAFDNKHYNDLEKLKLVAGQADDAAEAALAMLKTNPDKDKEKAVKKLQDDIKMLVKKNS